MSHVHIHIYTSGFDPALIPPRRVKQVKGECRHTPCPEGYCEWHGWAERASKTHAQIKCKCCGKWSVWLPKTEARKVNREDRKKERAAVKAYEELWETRKILGIENQGQLRKSA